MRSIKRALEKLKNRDVKEVFLQFTNFFSQLSETGKFSSVDFAGFFNRNVTSPAVTKIVCLKK